MQTQRAAKPSMASHNQHAGAVLDEDPETFMQRAKFIVLPPTSTEAKLMYWPCIQVDSPGQLGVICERICREQPGRLDAKKMKLQIIRVMIMNKQARGVRPCVFLLGRNPPNGDRFMRLPEGGQQLLDFDDGFFPASEAMEGHQDFWEAVEWTEHNLGQLHGLDQEESDTEASPEEKFAIFVASTTTTTPQAGVALRPAAPARQQPAPVSPNVGSVAGGGRTRGGDGRRHQHQHQQQQQHTTKTTTAATALANMPQSSFPQSTTRQTSSQPPHPPGPPRAVAEATVAPVQETRPPPTRLGQQQQVAATETATTASARSSRRNQHNASSSSKKLAPPPARVGTPAEETSASTATSAATTQPSAKQPQQQVDAVASVQGDVEMKDAGEEPTQSIPKSRVPAETGCSDAKASPAEQPSSQTKAQDMEVEDTIPAPGGSKAAAPTATPGSDKMVIEGMAPPRNSNNAPTSASDNTEMDVDTVAPDSTKCAPGTAAAPSGKADVEGPKKGASYTGQVANTENVEMEGAEKRTSAPDGLDRAQAASTEDVEMEDAPAEANGVGATDAPVATLEDQRDSGKPAPGGGGDALSTPPKATRVSKAETPASNSSKGSAASNLSKASASLLREEDVVVVPFESVKPALRKAGFIFRKNFYGFPGKDPKKDSTAVQGRDYFTTEKDFWAHLCAYGLDACDKWSLEDRDRVDVWVRSYAYGLDSSVKKIPISHKLKGSSWSAFKRLGFRHLFTSGLSQEEVYSFPGITMENGTKGVNYFDDGYKMWNRILRFGFPENCTRLADDELKLQLVHHLLNHREPQTKGGRRRAKVETFNRIDPTKAEEDVQLDDSMNLGRGARSRAKRNSNQANLPPVKVNGPAAGSVPKTKKRKTDGKSSSAKKPKQSKNISKETPAGDKASDSDASATQSPPTASGVSLSSPELPKFEGSDKEKLVKCLEALKPSNESFTPHFDGGSSHFETNLNSIRGFLASVVSSRGEHGTKEEDPAALYVCGVPGIGKTSGVRHCCNEMVVSQEVEGETQNAKWIYVNSGKIKTTESFLEKVATGLGLKSTTEKSVSDKLKENLVVLVVDEIDFLIAESTNDIDAGCVKGTEQVVQLILDWANDRSLCFALIGISNSSGNVKYARLQQLGKFQETITFCAYREEDIVKILEARIGRSVVGPSALQLIAKRVAAKGGDVRRALEMTSYSIEQSLKTVTEAASTAGHLVVARHVAVGCKEHEEGGRDYRKLVEGLPVMAKIVLCVVTTFTKANLQTTTLQNLKDVVVGCLHKTNRLDDLLPTEEFLLQMENLRDMNLISTAGVPAGQSLNQVGTGLLDTEIRLRSSLQEVEDALESELTSKSSIYERIAQYAEKQRREAAGQSRRDQSK